MELQEFIDSLYAAGWKAPNDAQHERIKKVYAEIAALKERTIKLEDMCVAWKWEATAVKARELVALTRRVKELEGEIEHERVRLAGCGVAACQNTQETIKDRIGKGSYGYSASYESVCDAVDREMKYREALEKIASHGIYCSDINELDACDVMQSIASKALKEAVNEPANYRYDMAAAL